MPSPVPRYLRTAEEESFVPRHLRPHVVDFQPDPRLGVKIPGAGKHRAKFAPGLATKLLEFAPSPIVGDPMAGTGMLAWETGREMCLNDIDTGLAQFLDPLEEQRDCDVSYLPADQITWQVDVTIFSPPYYPKADRTRAAGHNDAKRGPVVGFRDSYPCDHPNFIGNPGGVEAIRLYREAMTRVYDHLTSICEAMIVVTKNWTRLGKEMRLDLDTILMAMDVGWECVERHGWIPNPSLWARYNASRGGGVQIEDVLIFEKA